MSYLPWHIGVDVSTASNTDEVLDLAGLKYKISKSPLNKVYIPDEAGNLRAVYFPGLYGITREDTLILGVDTDPAMGLGVVGTRQETLQNENAVTILDDLAGIRPIEYERAGPSEFGASIFVVAKLPDEKILVGGKDVGLIARLLFLNNHVGARRWEVRVMITKGDTLLAQKETSLKIKHTKNMGNRYGMARSMMTRVISDYSKLSEDLTMMSNCTLTSSEVDTIIEALFPLVEDQKRPGGILKDRAAVRSRTEDEAAENLIKRSAATVFFGLAAYRNHDATFGVHKVQGVPDSLQPNEDDARYRSLVSGAGKNTLDQDMEDMLALSRMGVSNFVDMLRERNKKKAKDAMDKLMMITTSR